MSTWLPQGSRFSRGAVTESVPTGPSLPGRKGGRLWRWIGSSRVAWWSGGARCQGDIMWGHPHTNQLGKRDNYAHLRVLWGNRELIYGEGASASPKKVRICNDLLLSWHPPNHTDDIYICIYIYPFGVDINLVPCGYGLCLPQVL
jgi:hypothetical protein